MNCESFTDLLDRYIDGDLNSRQQGELLDHATACVECAHKLREAELLKRLLSGMDDSVAVPLEAQAAWRRAVKAEASRKKIRRHARLATGIAAALVIALGSGYFLKYDNAEVSGAPTLTILEADGASKSAENAGVSQYAAWRKIRTADAQGAYEALQALSDEYGGTIQSTEDGAYRIELPSQYLEEFLQASSRIGEELDAEAGESSGEMVTVYVQFITQ